MYCLKLDIFFSRSSLSLYTWYDFSLQQWWSGVCWVNCMPVLSKDVLVPVSLRLHLPVVNKCALLLLLEFFLVKDPQVTQDSLFSLITMEEMVVGHPSPPPHQSQSSSRLAPLGLGFLTKLSSLSSLKVVMQTGRIQSSNKNKPIKI